MATEGSPHILLTNDDGIQSPGLWAAAEALSTLGFVNVVAPRDQSTGAGRSMPATVDGVIEAQKMEVRGQPWTVYAVGGTPAQAVLHGVLEILPERPALTVSGINYGLNVGSGVTISGTVGAAMEAASLEIPSLAVSLETEDHYHRSHSTEIDFRVAASFTAYFAERLLNKRMPMDVDLLKLDIPSDATPDTPWRVTRLSRRGYYVSRPPSRESWDEPARIGYRQTDVPHEFEPDTDVYALAVDRVVSVTPLSLDFTSRTDLGDLSRLLSVPDEES